MEAGRIRPRIGGCLPLWPVDPAPLEVRAPSKNRVGVCGCEASSFRTVPWRESLGRLSGTQSDGRCLLQVEAFRAGTADSREHPGGHCSIAGKSRMGLAGRPDLGWPMIADRRERWELARLLCLGHIPSPRTFLHGSNAASFLAAPNT